MDSAEMVSEINQPDVLACPHCGTGRDGVALGLFWDSYEVAWKCVICGHRSFEHKKRTDSQLREERVWDKLLEAYDREEALPSEDQDDWAGNVINI